MKKYKKEELELLSNKDITNLLLEEKGKQKTADLFKKIIKLLELPESTFDQKIGDYYTSLTLDKRFVLLDNNEWDIRDNHSIKIELDEEEDEEEIEEEEVEEETEEEVEDNDTIYDDENDITDDDDDIDDLSILNEDEMDEEN